MEHHGGRSYTVRGASEAPRAPTPSERIGDFREFVGTLPLTELARKARCMDCGVPLQPRLPARQPDPDWTISSTATGSARRSTSSTGRTSSPSSRGGFARRRARPPACSRSRRGMPVRSSRSSARSSTAPGRKAGSCRSRLPRDRPPRRRRRGGAGRAGLRAATRARGRSVVVYERDEAAGGLIRFGVPSSRSRNGSSSVASSSCARKASSSDSAWTSALTSRRRSSAASTTQSCSPSALACRATYRCRAGSSTACIRDGVPVRPCPRDRRRGDWRASVRPGKHVVVIGGGDTGADCVAHAHRERAASVLQIELLGEPPLQRPDDVTPWPRWPMKLRTSYALHEGGDREFSLTTTALAGTQERVEEIRWQLNTGAPPFDLAPGDGGVEAGGAGAAGARLPRARAALLDAFGVERDERGNAAGNASRRRPRVSLPRGRPPRAIADRLGDP